MQIAVRSYAWQQEALEHKGFGSARIRFITRPEELSQEHFDVVIDLLYTPGTTYPLLPVNTLLLVHAVTATCKRLPEGAVRLNAWPGFLQRPVMELAATDGNSKARTEECMACLGWQYEWVADIPGFISSRVIAAIINEAYFALEEELSSAAEIDTAMRLGTNYPFGPFEWAQRIGVNQVYELLNIMSTEDERYTPAALLASAVS
ncbi:3-hydroxyacyl-CoA dehydrogenase family protein [Filimonas effusa]|uniref:3-hydroxyacyl-CoA dehydrogenase C-terminal domain-containing protein n=1 Tax=Filimonas effusa TaxID=2508721 RepID=A0A4Q1D645_9BACT|nr:3-hydroxyacyl-CoA dehydrogenase family protein [Filimonas effusa]RXK83436.1 hypothetical protein ESB13_15180 [Filimonas effusa]